MSKICSFFLLSLTSSAIFAQRFPEVAVSTAVNFTSIAIDGFLAGLEERSIKNFTKNEGKCKTTLTIIGDNELVVSRQPIGFCYYCCKAKSHVNIRFHIFTKNDPHNPRTLKLLRRPGAVRDAGLDPKKKTVIYVHGFTEYALGPSGREIRDAFLNATDNNVILVDWSDLAATPWYINAVRNTKFMGNALAKFLAFYHDSGEIPIESIHLIGFSLGAQIAGFTGKYLRKDLKLMRITALDAAFPLFNDMGPKDKLMAYDAEFVDAIHTDGGNLGMLSPYAHVDFFPNGGTALQPGCQTNKFIDTEYLNQIFACSHLRAWKYYVESVRNPRAFPATRCKQWRKESQCDFTLDDYMGYGVSSNAQGNYFLLTHAEQPFSMAVPEQMLA